MKFTLCCLLQNRLGALDRVLGALTYRGFVPDNFYSTFDQKAGCLQVVVTFECQEESTCQKLVKFLEKQVYVLEARAEAMQPTENVQVVSLADFASSVLNPVVVKRRVSNAHS